MQSSGIPVKFNIVWGNTAVVPYIRQVPQASQIGLQAGAASLTDGFPPLTFTPVGAGGADPWGADFNGILNQITGWSRWYHAGGPIQYDSAFAGSAANGYPKGAVLQSKVVTGRFLISLVENNTADPDVAGGSWTDFGSYPRGYIDGCTLSNDGGSPNTVIDIAAGAARADTNDWNIDLTAMTKTTGAFVAGTGNGGLDTGAVAASTWYAVYAIRNPTTGAVDVLLSLSFSAPTMPSGFTKKRYIGAIKTDAAIHILAFTQVGDDFLWNTPVTEISNTAPGTTNRVTQTLGGVPTGNKVGARVQAAVSANGLVYISSPDEIDQVPSQLASPGFTVGTTGTATMAAGGQVVVRTNASAQINFRQSTNVAWTLVTIGYIDQRGKNA